MLFLTSAFLCGLWYFIAGEPVKTETSCLSGGNSKVLCVCDPREMIHIINVLYQTATDNCQTVDGQCQFLQESSQEGLIQRCNGQQVCNETISDFKVKKKCGNFTALFVNLTYECIAEHPINFCEETEFSSDIVYLSTPEYGRNSSGLPHKQTCECDVTGTNMTVEILEMQFDFNPTNKEKLTLTGESSSWSSVSHILVYNLVVLNNSDHLRLEYEAKGISKHTAWIRIKGSQNATVSCNMKTNKTSSTSAMSTTTQSSSTAAAAVISASPISLSHSAPAPYTPTTLMHARKDSSNTTAVAVGSVFAVLILVAVVIAIVLIMMRRKRMKSRKNSNDRLDAAYYSQPDSTSDLHAYEMSLAAMDASEGTESDVSSPTTPHYFVLEPFARQQCSSEEEKVEARKSKEGNNSEPKSNLPYTTKRLEELYAKVIPKKFRSTREMRDKEMKVKGRSSSSKRKSETSLNGKTGNGYDDVEVNTRNKISTKQSRLSSSKSDHDYQEIDTLTPPSQEIDTLTPQSQEIDTMSPPSDSVFTLPVPPKMYDVHDMKVPDESEAKNSKSQTIKRGNKTPKESGRTGKSLSNKDTRESVVMVDNILYEGSSKDKMKSLSSEVEKVSETGSAVSNKTIADGDASAATAATNRDKNRVHSEREQHKDDSSQRNTDTRTHHVDELVMVDNVLYEGNSGDKDGKKNKRTSSRTLPGHEYEDVCESVSSKPSLTSVKGTMNSPYEDITIS